MADSAQTKMPKEERSTRYAEIFAGLVLIAFLVAVMFFGLAKMIPGMAPVAEKGAGLVAPSDAVFYLVASIAMLSAVGVAFSRNIIYSALSLLGTLLATGGLYVFLNADYVAITQLLIYVGGVLILILFAVMLTNRISDEKHSNPSTGIFPGLALLAALVGVLGFIAAKTPWKTGTTTFNASSTVDLIGDLFLGHYLLPFEVISLLLLATLIGAVVIARKEIKE